MHGAKNINLGNAVLQSYTHFVESENIYPYIPFNIRHKYFDTSCRFIEIFTYLCVHKFHTISSRSYKTNIFRLEPLVKCG